MLQDARRDATGAVIVSWASPEESLWVASIDGEYAGMVEFADGHFIVRDPTGHELGSHSNLKDAKSVVTDRAQAPSLLVAVQETLHNITDSIAAALPKPAPQYHRSA